MPDNVLINGVTVAGGQTIATFADSGGIEHEKVLNEYIDDGTGQPVLVSQSNPLPVTGTIVIDTSTLATKDNQTNALQKTQVVDGSGNVIGATSNALDINIKSGSIANTTFAATQATATNLKAQAENYQGGAAVGAANPLQVTGANGTFPITFTGTHDENLAQVNGATVNVGVGAASTGTQRVITATDSTIGTVTSVTAVVLNSDVRQSTATNLKTQAENYQGGTAVGSGNPLQVTGANGSFPTTEVAATALNSGVTIVTTAGTRVQVASNACKSVTVKAKIANTGKIYVGGSTVASSNGFELSAGDSLSVDISNTSLIYIDSSVNSEGISFIFIS